MFYRILHVLQVAFSAPLQVLFLTPKVPYMGRTLKGKLCVISGGTSGVGLAVAEEMVKRGCDVILLVRDKQKAIGVVAQLSQLNNLFMGTQRAEVRAIECELSSLVSVRMCVAELKETVKKRNVDYLCCTAGVFLQESSINRTNPLEHHYCVNHLGHFALLMGLMDVLRASQTRIAMLSSDLMVFSDDCSPYRRPKIGDGAGLYERTNNTYSPAALWRSLQAFASSKLANFALFQEIHARFPELSVVAVHPGHINSHTSATPFSGVLGAFWGLLKGLVLIGHSRACQPVLHCLLTDAVPKGSYFHSVFGVVPPSPWFLPSCLLSAVWRKNVLNESMRACGLNE